MFVMISVIILLLSLYIFSRKHKTLPFLNNESNILLLVAHPDDEVMFFGPTLCSIIKHKIPIKVLCLSNGNADSLGKIREKELSKSLLNLGISKFTIINDPDLEDGFHLWDSALISSVLESHISSCNTILTFDSFGISGHPNHISLFHGVLLFLKTNPNIQGYSLDSIGIHRKFTFFLDIIPSLLTSSSLVQSSLTDYLKIRSSMLKHESQLVWFRMLYIIFSRYMYLNAWTEIVTETK